jgi:hypothetical protein
MVWADEHRLLAQICSRRPARLDVPTTYSPSSFSHFWARRDMTFSLQLRDCR